MLKVQVLLICIQSQKELAAWQNCAFEPLFESQAQAENIRSVQGMLQRFRTLFNVQSAIRGNITKGEYDLAVREYQKAKSIVLPFPFKLDQKCRTELSFGFWD